ncbi:MAG: twin-arginine translocase subunit TatB [Alphaproteobacteria bacterium]|nr:MAG: twin-arginine translocase subunit TatB [Alphaproteobacteria bacterium]
MFDIGYSELLLIAIVALVVIGPKDLPRVMRTVGQWVGRARGMARHFRSGIDTMMREAELEEMEKKWKEENERIMRDHPLAAPFASDASLPPPEEAPVEVPPHPAAPAPPADEASPQLPGFEADPAWPLPFEEPAPPPEGAEPPAPKPDSPRELP